MPKRLQFGWIIAPPKIKNWTLYCFFICYINSDITSTKSIKLTHLWALIHHDQVEKSLKQKGKVLDFDDYKNCVLNANNGKTTCIEELNNFLDVKDCSSRFKVSKTLPKQLLSNFCEVHFLRVSKRIPYKTAFDGNSTELCFLTAEALKEGVLAPRGITVTRKINIIKKLQGMSIPETG